MQDNNYFISSIPVPENTRDHQDEKTQNIELAKAIKAYRDLRDSAYKLDEIHRMQLIYAILYPNHESKQE